VLVILVQPGRSPDSAIARSSQLPITYLQGAPVLDPNQFRFDSLPPFTSEGGFQVPYEITSRLGFDPSSFWNVGDRPTEVLKLGTFQNAFGLEAFNLQTISRLTNLPLDKFNLQDFELIAWQSLETLVQAIPELKNALVSQVQPIADLVSEMTGQLDRFSTINDLIQQAPDLAQTALGEILDLQKYSLDDIPGLDRVQLGAFFQAGSSTIAGVPGLAQVVASQFPIPLQIPAPAVVTRVDIPLQQVEGNRSNTAPISGGNRVGFNVPCQQACAHLETREGHQWFAGDRQQVQGGEGILASTFNGQEPTGRMPYGSVFKVVVANVNEAAATVDTQLFFRFCWRNSFVDLGCTPYGIGPVPFLSYRESDPIFLGVADFGGVSETSSRPEAQLVSSPSPASAVPRRPTPPRRSSGHMQPTFGYVQP
jgi:hypothetical protein